MTNPDDTLLGRCTAVYEEAFEAAVTNEAVATKYLRTYGIAVVLDYLAAELVVMNQRDPRLTVHELARRLRIEAAGRPAGREQENA